MRQRLYLFIITDGQSVKKVVEPKLGESVKVIVVFVATGEQRFEIDLTTLHSKPFTGTDVVVRGVVFDQAAVAFKGLINIKKGAKGSKAFLRADALLLGDKARADLIPSLTIKENEVQAGHGATVGRINDEQLFYLMSRGLTRDKAIELLVRGFLSSVLREVPSKSKVQVERALTRYYERQTRFSYLQKTSRSRLLR